MNKVFTSLLATVLLVSGVAQAQYSIGKAVHSLPDVIYTIRPLNQQEAQHFFANGFCAQGAAMVNFCLNWKWSRMRAFSKLHHDVTPINVTVVNASTDIVRLPVNTYVAGHPNGLIVHQELARLYPSLYQWIVLNSLLATVAGLGTSAVVGYELIRYGIARYWSADNEAWSLFHPDNKAWLAGAGASAAVAATALTFAYKQSRARHVGKSLVCSNAVVYRPTARHAEPMQALVENGCYLVHPGYVFEETVFAPAMSKFPELKLAFASPLAVIHEPYEA